ncbi:MAG: glycoside hydrolase family 16 protein, partial [Bacteroidetes bacterium]|nr:glycoside hydrolase family 16 protein [Bacteroidota bacterium]
MKNILLAFIAALFSSLCYSQTKHDTVFFEDFNGPKLDRSKWNVEVTGNTVNNEQQAYIDSSSVLYFVHGKAAEGARHGALAIKAIYHPGYKSMEANKYDFLSGRINTRKKMEFTYGTASARMKI